MSPRKGPAPALDPQTLATLRSYVGLPARLPGEDKTCGCGCGQTPPNWERARYVRGHNPRSPEQVDARLRGGTK
jgi:hypothetical protein